MSKDDLSIDEAKLVEITRHWKTRVIHNIEVINQIRIELEELSRFTGDDELVEIAKRLRIARCRLANTVTLRMLLNGVIDDIISDTEIEQCRIDGAWDEPENAESDRDTNIRNAEG